MATATKDVQMATASDPLKHLALNNSIQTNFGDDYVFQVIASQEMSTLAVSLSTNVIKLYSPGTGQYLGECVGHDGTIHEISFSVPGSPNVISSCSSDGTIRAWDSRTFQQVSLLRPKSSEEVFSFSFGGLSGNLLAGGCNAQVNFWDWRNGKQVACLEEAHMEDVTKVQFVPNQQSKLISSSVDGLICLFDTSGEINDDDHLESVMNVETSIARVGFFGKMNEKLWCLTHIETLSIWDWKEASREVIFDDARTLASDRWNEDNVDYFVDCHYSGVDDRLWVIGGTASGTLGYFPVNSSPTGTIGSPDAILAGGHTGIVRSLLHASSTTGILSQRGIFGWSGGEDGRLCCWSSGDSLEAQRSWISPALTMRTEKTRSKNRHHPY